MGIDIGGTFTDVCVIGDQGEVWSTKLLTTPADPSIGFMIALKRALRADFDDALREIVHATTVATNAILEGKIARLGLITTAGFRDVLEIGRHFRRDLYNLFLEKPPVLVPRQRRCEVAERIDAEGAILHPLDCEQVMAATDRLLADGVEAIVICFLHSYASPAHELAAAAIVHARCDTPVVMSHTVCSEYREYERFSTAAVHGAVMPSVQQYIGNIETAMETAGISAALSVMQSNGGMTSAAVIRQRPGLIVESGPAAGVISAVEVGRRLGIADLIAFDMGGTTAKATLVREGRITLTTDYEVGGGLQGGFGAGYPVRMPVVDLIEVGTGGGSIAYVDEVGQLHVGPHSAGADPGPSCYGRGGTAATITDADLILGRISAEHFLGGEFRLDREAAARAVQANLAQPLRMSLERAAEGVIDLANAQMVQALQLVSVQRGIDPRDYTMIAFGGAGPMHAADVATELGCRKVIVPPEAGVQSAWGLLVADARRDMSADVHSHDPQRNPRTIAQLYRDLVRQGQDELCAAGFGDEQIHSWLAIDVRYAGQAYELTIELLEPPLFDAPMVQRINRLFHDEHQRCYGHSDHAAPLQWVTLRAAVVGNVPRPAVSNIAQAREPLEERREGLQRMVWRGKEYTAPRYSRSSLGAGDCFRGPALVVQADASLAVPPGVELTVQPTGDILLTLEAAR